MHNHLLQLAREVGQHLQKQRLMLTTAESCTGGLIAEIITSVPGSSAWFERGFVTYSNLAKQEMLGVAQSVIEAHGAVSEQTALAMAAGALKHSHANISVAVTGIAGPDGGSAEKPVGTVWVAWAKKQATVKARLQQWQGNRESIRQQAAEYALAGIISLLGNKE